MTCREITEFVADYLDGSIAPLVRRQFEAHLEVCPDCVNYLRQYRDTVRLTASAGDMEVVWGMPEELVRAIVLAAGH